MPFNVPSRVVVTGHGAICSLGESSQAIWNAILDYRMGYGIHAFDDPTIVARFFGFLPANRERYRGLPKPLLKMMPAFARNALLAARDAMGMAFGRSGPADACYDPFECGVAIGTGWGGLDEFAANHDSYRDTGFADSYATVASMNNVATAGIAMAWSARGPQGTTTAACASGAMAIGDAYEAIRSGRARMMLAGGSESLKGLSNVWSIDVIQALSKEQADPARACCPFGLGRSGFILSEGAAVLCLENRADALARGATVLAEITGYASTTDACDMTAPAGDRLARVRVIRRALANAGRHGDHVDYINAHGTSTPLNDVDESEGIKRALGERAYRIPVSSTKSYTGHLIGAAGAMESIFCLKTIETGVVPATRNLTAPDPACDLDYVPNVHRTGQRIDVAMNLSFGFGGANCALIFERAA